MEYKSELIDFEKEDAESKKRIQDMESITTHKKMSLEEAREAYPDHSYFSALEKEERTMNIEEIKERVNRESAIYLYCKDGDGEDSEISNDVQYLLSIIEQQNQLLKEWWTMFAEQGQIGKDSFGTRKEYEEFLKLVMGTRKSLQAIRK